MSVREGPPEPAPPPKLHPVDIPAEQARGGEIILRRPWQRAVFIAGLAGAMVVGLILIVLQATMRA